MSLNALTAIAVLAAALGTLAAGAYAGRGARSTSDFLVASRSIGPGTNAAAIAGEYLSAASFLGVAGLVAKYGADALWYPIGFTAGYLILLLFVAAPLRRTGAYTVPDFAEFRLSSPVARTASMIVVVGICVLYLVPQLQGAGLTLDILLGLPPWVGVVAIGALVILNVVGGGMRSVTFAQAIAYWLKLTAVAVPALAIGLMFLSNSRDLGEPLPPRVPAATTIDISRTVSVTVDDPTGVRIDGVVDGQSVQNRQPAPGTQVIDSGSVVRLAAGAATPIVAGAPVTGDLWAASGGGLGGGHPLYQVFSLMIATFLGAVGLPHVLVRFYTNPNGRAARRTALNVIAALSVFYLFPTILGALARVWTPQILTTGNTDAAVLLLPSAALGATWGTLIAALVAAGAVAAFLATSSGLLVSIAGVMSTDLLPAGVRSFRLCAVIGGLIPIGLALGAGSLDLSRSVGLVFAVSAATFCPLLLLGIWWRGLTAIGAVTGLIVGGLTSITAIVLVSSSAIDETLLGGWPHIIADYPAAFTVPLTFATMIGISLATRDRIPSSVGRIFAAMHVPERLGLGVERTPKS